MQRTIAALNKDSLTRASTGLFLAAAALLAAAPAAWLFGTWLDNSYDSMGLIVAFVMAALVAWHVVRNPRLTSAESAPETRRVLILFAVTASVRIAGKFLAINLIQALALAADVYAAGLWLGLHRRGKPLSPGFLAAAFLFSLPVEHLCLRVLGFALQQVSATSACALLQAGFGKAVSCAGSHLAMDAKDVSVDLPCAGARGLMQLFFLWTLLMAAGAPRWPRVVVGYALALALAMAGNIGRICVLAVLIARPAWASYRDVMASPWHDLIGGTSLLMAGLPLLFVARWWRPKVLAKAARPDLEIAGRPAFAPQVPAGFAAALALLAVVAHFLPASPLDVSAPSARLVLPPSLVGQIASPQPLSAKEESYFKNYGGQAARALYGDLALVVVTTSSPLRHLHAPNECLEGSGHHVHFIGVRQARLTSAVYRSEAPDGRIYRVSVTFFSANGVTAESVPEVIWHWLGDSGGTWTMVERIAPWDAPLADDDRAEQEVARFFELPQAALANVPGGSLTPQKTEDFFATVANFFAKE